MNPPNRMPIAGLKQKDLVGMPWRVAFALQADGWYLRSDIIWAKPAPMPESILDRPTKSHEYIFLLAKSPRYFYDDDAIKEKMAASSIRRLTQPNATTQAGGRKDAKTGNRSAHKARRNLAEKFIKQERWAQRMEGWQEATDVDAPMRRARTVWEIASQPFEGEFCRACRAYFTPDTKANLRLEIVGTGASRKKILHCLCGETEAWLSHFATFPPELAERCIKAGSPVGGVVLDPFAGAGTTGMVADRLGRKAIMIELNADYAALMGERIKSDGPLFAAIAEPSVSDLNDAEVKRLESAGLFGKSKTQKTRGKARA